MVHMRSYYNINNYDNALLGFPVSEVENKTAECKDYPSNDKKVKHDHKPNSVSTYDNLWSSIRRSTTYGENEAIHAHI